MGTWRAAVLAGAGLCGAAGVSLAAVAAHRVQSPALGSAALMLMVHAAAVVAVAAIESQAPRRTYWLAPASLMLLGVALFGGDITLSTFAARHLFPMAAPSGGTILILSWLVLAVVALIDRRAA